MEVIGHDSILLGLGGEIPPVLLFSGPPSVGKWTTAEWLRGKRGIHDSDVLRIRKLTGEAAQDFVQFARTAPIGHEKLAIIRLDGALRSNQNTLLKTLEEAPPTLRVVLIHSQPIMDTVASRGQTIRFPLLAPEALAEILVFRNFRSGEATRLAELSGGQVRVALSHAGGRESKVLPLLALTAIQNRDVRALEGLAGRWTTEHTEMLATACRETITLRWRFFDPAEVEGFKRSMALRILTSLRADLRPRLVVRSALMSVLRGTP